MRIRMAWLTVLLALATCGKDEGGSGGGGGGGGEGQGGGGGGGSDKTKKPPTGASAGSAAMPKPGAGPVTIAVTGTKVVLNGVELSGQPKMFDIVAIFGKPDRTWDTGASNKVHTWDSIGLVAYEPREPSDGRCISTTFPYKPMGAAYSPKTLFTGTAIIDGEMMLPTLDIATLKARPGATQPYGADSVMFDKGLVHVFTTVKGGSIDLVEISYWNKPKPAPGEVPLFAGKYRTSEGWMTLKQKASDPTDVFGSYAKGSIKCKATGSSLACSWYEGGPAGHAQFTRDAKGNMRGTWGSGARSTGGGAWTCTLLTAGALE